MKAIHDTLWMDGHAISGLGDPLDSQDAATMNYVDGYVFPITKSFTILSPQSSFIPVFYCHRNIKILSMTAGIYASGAGPTITLTPLTSPIFGTYSTVGAACVVTDGTPNTFTQNINLSSGRYYGLNMSSITNVAYVHVTILYTYKTIPDASVVFGGPVLDMFIDYNKVANRGMSMALDVDFDISPTLETNGALFYLDVDFDVATTVDKSSLLEFNKLELYLEVLGEKAKNQVSFTADIDLFAVPSFTTNGRVPITIDLDLMVTPERLTSGDVLFVLDGELDVAPTLESPSVLFTLSGELQLKAAVDHHAKLMLGISSTLLPPNATI